MNIIHPNVVNRSDYAKALEQPNHDSDDHHEVQNAFDHSVHRYVCVDEPEQYANDNKYDDHGDQGHLDFLLLTGVAKN
jgi:hypothetical protein